MSSSQSSSKTTTSTTLGSTHTTTSSSTSHKTAQPDTGVTDPAKVQKLIDSTREEIEHSHRQNLAAFNRMIEPVRKYAQQKDLVAQLAMSRQQNQQLKKALQHQGDENLKLRAQLALYQEKEAVQAATAVSMGASEMLTLAKIKQSQALIVQLVQSLAVPLPPDPDKCSVTLLVLCLPDPIGILFVAMPS